MSYDPAWDMPQINWQQQGSWEEGSIPPVVEPDAGTQVCLGPVAQEWVPWIAGACDQMRNPSAWIVADDTAMFNTLRRVDTLLGLLFGARGACVQLMIRLEGCELQTSSDGGVTWVAVPGWDANFCNCVTDCVIPAPPLLPPGSTPAQRACSIAGYLSTDIVQAAIQQAITAYDTDLSLLNLAANIAALTFAFDLPITAFVIYAAYDLYQFFTAGNIAALRAAEGDPSLWAAVTCAIYDAIRLDGQVTEGNCAAIIANICAIPYSSSMVISAICAFVTQLGCSGLRAAQIPGVLAVADCSGCLGEWCHTWNFTTTNPAPVWAPTTHGHYRAGAGWEADNTGSGTLLTVQATFVPTTIHQFCLTWRTDKISGGDARQIDFYRAGVHITTKGLTGGIPTDPQHDCFDLCPGFACDQIIITIDSADTLATTWLEGVDLLGKDGSPFGGNNCTPSACP